MKYVCCVLVFFAPLVGVLSTSSSAEEPGRWHPLGEHTQETGRLAELGAKICLHAGDEPGCERFLKILARTDQHFTRKCNQGWGAKALREFQVDWRQRARRQRFHREDDQRRGVAASCAQGVTLLGTAIFVLRRRYGACFCLAWGTWMLVGSGGRKDEVPWVACHDARRVCGGRQNSSIPAVMTAPR